MAFDVFVEGGYCGAVDGGGVANVFVERGLIVESGGKSNGGIVVKRRYYRQRRPWRNGCLAVERPVVEPQSVVECVVRGTFGVALESVGVHDVAFEAS